MTVQVLLLALLSAPPGASIEAVVGGGTAWAGSEVAFELHGVSAPPSAVLDVLASGRLVASVPLIRTGSVARAAYRFTTPGRYRYTARAGNVALAESREPLTVYVRTLGLRVRGEGVVSLADGEPVVSVVFSATPSLGTGQYTFEWRRTGAERWTRGGRQFVASLPAGLHGVECRVSEPTLQAETATVAVRVQPPPAPGALDVAATIVSERCERHCELEMRAQASNGSGHYAYRWSSELDDPDAPTIGGDVLRHAFAMGRRRTRLRAIDLETRQEVTRDLVFDLPRVVAVVHTASSSPALAFHLLDVEVVTGRPARLRAQRAALSLEQMCSGPPTWRAPWHVLVCVGPSSARARAKIGRFDETIECAGRCEPALEDLIGRAAASVRRGAVEAVPEPAPLGQARLVITGAPATVEIDGEAAGRVPLDVAIESHLDHVVRVEVEPCKRVDVHRVGARSLEVKRLRVGRCEAPRLLSIETRPAGARVLIGGHAVPSPTPLAGLPVRAGRLPLEVTLAGHETWTGTVDMDVHAKSVVVTLRPIESPPVVINRGNLQYLFVDEQLTGLIDRGERRTLTGLGRWPHEVCLYHRTTLVAAAARCRPVAVPSTQALVFEGEHAPVELDVSTEDAPRPSTLGIMGGLSMTFLTAGTRWVPSGTTVFSLGLRASHVSLLGFESALTAEFSYFDAASEALTSGGVIPTATIQRSLELGVLPTIPVFNRRLSVGAVVQVSSLLESINPQVAHQRTMHHWGLALGPSLRVRAFRFWDHGWIDVGYDFRFQLAPRELFQTFGRVHRAGVWITWDVL